MMNLYEYSEAWFEPSRAGFLVYGGEIRQPYKARLQKESPCLF
jgi:hypothetical protein